MRVPAPAFGRGRLLWYNMLRNVHPRHVVQLRDLGYINV